MSIATRLTLVVSIMASLLLLAVGYGSWIFEDRGNRDTARSQARLLAGVLKISAEAELRDHGKLGAITDLVDRSGIENVVFFGADGRAIAPVPTEEDPVVYGRIRQVIDQQRPDGDLFANQERMVYVYSVPLFDSRGRSAGALEVRQDVDRATAQANWLGPGAWLGASLLLLFAALIVLYTRHAIARPIAELMDGMDHVIKDDLTHVLPLTRQTEIGRIAYRFNEMTARLRHAQEQVQRSAETKLQLEGRVRRSEKLATLGQLSAEIAHEVGTPLNVISGRARKLQLKATDPHQVEKNAGIIADQAERITKIIQRVLDLARSPTPKRETVSLAHVVADAVVFLEDALQQARITVEQTVASDLQPLTADADGLQQVVLNLLLNAIQAMDGHPGTIRIKVSTTHRRKEGLDLSPAQPFVVLTVEDEGRGVPQEHLPQIFDPFFTTKEKGEGTGLGLTVVHGIVKAHDGWVEAAAAEKKGTIFRVYLPQDEASPSRENEVWSHPVSEGCD